MIHIVQVSDILLTPADVPARTVQPAVTAEVLDDLGQWLADQGLDTGPVPPGERTTVLGQAVEYYYTRLTETVADLSPEGLMAFLVSHDEALVHDSASRAQRLPSQLACFGATSLRAQDLLTAERKGVEAAVASRFLARGGIPGREGPHQPGHRWSASSFRPHRRHARRPRPDQARLQQPRAAGGVGV